MRFGLTEHGGGRPTSVMSPVTWPSGSRRRAPGAAFAALLVLAASLSAACTTRHGPTAAQTPQALAGPPPGQGRIYVYRPGSPFLGANVPDVVVNGKRLGELHAGEVLYRNAQPGRYRVRISTDLENPITFRLAPDGSRYIGVAPRWDGLGWRLTGKLTPAAKAEGAIVDLIIVNTGPARDGARD